MTALQDPNLDESPTDRQWRKVYLFGGYAALIAFCGTLADIILGSITNRNLLELPQSAIERFIEFQQSWLLGLYHLDLLNVVIAMIMIPTYFALFALHRKSNLPYAAFALVISFLGTSVFISQNSALPMLELSIKYHAAADEAQKLLFAAAGEALLVKGVHGSLGVFLGFILQSTAGICMSLVMLHGNIFKRTVSYFGIIGNTLLIVYIFLVTFAPAIKKVAVIIAAPGGILAIMWILMVGFKLIKMAKQNLTAD